MIALIWTGIDLHLKLYRDKAMAGAFQDTGNLARVFEEHIVRVVNEIDKTVLLARSAFLQDPEHFDLRQWAQNPFLVSNFAVQLSFIDADGVVKSSTAQSGGPPVSAIDPDYLRAHLDAREDAMVIAKPTIERRTGQWTVQISRAVRDREGRFRGIVAASLESDLLAEFYRSIDVGNDGGILLLGTDGVVRASAGFRTNMIDRSMRDARLYQQLDRTPAGSFLTHGRQDGVARLVSYRAVRGMPLVLYVGRAEQEVMADYPATRRNYMLLAAALTLLILMSVGLSLLNRRRLEGARDALEVSEARATEKSRQLSITLDNINQGIMMVDEAGHVPVFNGRLIEMLELPEQFCIPGWSYKDIISYLWERGDFGPDGARLDPRVREFIRKGEGGNFGVHERVRPNGTVLEIHSVALPGGGVVRTFSDVTERRRNIEKIAHMACHDTLTGLVNRVLLREDLEHVIGRLRRYDEPFAVMCLDLDGFKGVNDTLGHGAGDEVLRMVARRLKLAVRDVDTVARVGGDEFAIVMANADNRARIADAAERILETVAAPYLIDSRHVTIGTSIGIALAPADGEDVDTLLRRADLALYGAKAEGRNCCRFYGVDMEPCETPEPRPQPRMAASGVN